MSLQMIQNLKPALLCIGIYATVLLLGYLAFENEWTPGGFLGASFLFGLPYLAGFLLGWRAGRSTHVLVAIGWVILGFGLFSLLVFLPGLEGLICLVIIVGPFVVSSALGVSVAYLARRWLTSNDRMKLPVLAAVFLLPLASSTYNDSTPPAPQIVIQHDSLHIVAAPAAVWPLVLRVQPIADDELPNSWVQTIGFPRPRHAILDTARVGGIREAVFDGGLSFTETVTAIAPERLLRFSIAAHPDQIPAQTLDRHVTVGGTFFDVLEGEYRLAPMPDGTTMLHLTSRFRVSTRVNPYAAWWCRRIMGDIQQRILRVHQLRATGTIKLPVAAR